MFSVQQLVEIEFQIDCLTVMPSSGLLAQYQHIQMFQRWFIKGNCNCIYTHTL